MELAAGLVVLLEHERVESQLVAPQRCGETSRPSADNYHVMHQTICNFKFQIPDSRFQISDNFRSQISDLVCGERCFR
jgi:hypothetical protein